MLFATDDGVGHGAWVVAVSHARWPQCKPPSIGLPSGAPFRDRHQMAANGSSGASPAELEIARWLGCQSAGKIRRVRSAERNGRLPAPRARNHRVHERIAIRAPGAAECPPWGCFLCDDIVRSDRYRRGPTLSRPHTHIWSTPSGSASGTDYEENSSTIDCIA